MSNEASLKEPSGRCVVRETNRSLERIAVAGGPGHGSRAAVLAALIGQLAFGSTAEADEATSWYEEFRATPPDIQEHEDFGASLAVDGDVMVVGSRVNNGLDDDAGAAYVYERDEPTGGWFLSRSSWPRTVRPTTGSGSTSTSTVTRSSSAPTRTTTSRSTRGPSTFSTATRRPASGKRRPSSGHRMVESGSDSASRCRWTAT